jgi:hypothetical protein
LQQCSSVPLLWHTVSVSMRISIGGRISKKRGFNSMSRHP